MTDVPTRAAPKKQKGATAKAAAPAVIHLDYELAELPSAQHRAGLAGLVLMVRWLDRNPDRRKGTLALTRVDAHGATLSLDLEGLQALFDETYAATVEESYESQPRKDRSKNVVEPLRIEEREKADKKGKVKKEKVYVYPVVVPRAPLLVDLEPASTDGKTPWVKLFRDMLWRTLRGVPATREPFEARAEGRRAKDADSVWADLTGAADKAVNLPSTYYLGAQSTTAEGVAFRDRARHQLLLHFWPYVASVYAPRVKRAKDAETEVVGYALAIPDVADLDGFCAELPSALRHERSPEVFRFRPREAIIDHPAESALDLARRLRARITATEGARRTGDLVLGVEVFHIDKEGNNVRILSAARVEPAPEMVDAYIQLRKLGLWDPVFRARRLVNLLDGEPWYTGFDRIIATSPLDKITFGSEAFRHDARVSFQAFKQGETMTTEGEPAQAAALETIIHDLMQSYVSRRLDSKHQLTWEGVKDQPKNKRDDYQEKKHKIAKDAFLAVRSRTGPDFVSYFAGTLCSTFGFLPKDRYLLLADALKGDVERVRTLTLLALSAVG